METETRSQRIARMEAERQAKRAARRAFSASLTGWKAHERECKSAALAALAERAKARSR